MKLKPRVKPHRLNQWMANIIPVIEERSTLKVKIRLSCNYFLQSVVLIVVMLSICLKIQLDFYYIEYILAGIRLVFYLLTIKLNVIDMFIAIKILMALEMFTVTSGEILIIQTILLGVHLVFTLKLALSSEQRRGDFDERLGVTIPFFKEVVVVVCPYFVHNLPNQFNNLYYPSLALTIAHYIMCHFDNIYKFSVKKAIQAVSMFSLAANVILALIFHSTIERESIIIVGCISYVILSAWLMSVQEFDSFKIIQENPNGFAEWDYKQYFDKLIYLISNYKQQGNQQILRGFYKYHQHICFSTECPIRYCHQLQKQLRQSDEYFQQELATIVRYIENYLRSQLQIATIKYPNLKRYYIFYTSPSLQALKYCNKDDFVEFREAVRIQKMFRIKNIQFQKESNQKILKQAQHYIEIYIEKSSHLWRLLYDDNIDFGRFEKLGIDLLNLKEKIIQFQKHEMADSSILKLIKDFKEGLLGEEANDLKIMEQEASSKLYNFIEIHTKQYPILIISAESQTLQSIQNVNSSCCRLIGFSKKELLQKKINDILPDFVGLFHTKLLTQRSKQLLYEKQKKLWTLVYVVTRSGYVFESSLHILQLNSMKGRRWSCILTPTNQANILIITDEQGKIQCMTSNILNINLDITIVGKYLCPGVFDDMMSKVEEWRPIGNYIDHLFDQDYQVEAMLEYNAMIRVKSSVPLIHPAKLCVVEIELKKKQKTSIPRNHNDSKDGQEMLNLQWRFNYPNLYSNINYHNPIQIKLKDQEHYEFINYGEGINEMRYLNGQIQYKEDKSESSFEKDQTENSMVEIVDFNLKRQTYLEVMGKSRKKYPKPLVEFSIWIVVTVLVVIGISIANFMVFYTGSLKHSIYASSLVNLDLLKTHYSSIVRSSIELVYNSQNVWDTMSPPPIQSINQRLMAISSLSPLLSQNQSYINSFNLNYQLSSTTSFYDILSQFKLQANNIVNHPSSSFTFNNSGPIYQIMNISVNYITQGFTKLSSTLLQKYKLSISHDFTIYYCQFIALSSVAVIVLIRLFFIMNSINNQKNELLSIYLEVEQSIIQKILQRNNAFKFMLKYNKSRQNQDQQSQQSLKSDDENERSAKKKIKSMSKIPYFYYILLWAVACLGFFAINAYTEITYINVMNSDLQQIMVFGQANMIKEDSYMVLQYIVNSATSRTIQNQDMMKYSAQKVQNVYSNQMKFRENILLILNKGLLSKDFTNFFLDFWVKNACTYISTPNCSTDYFSSIKQGGDQFWSMFVRKLDRLTADLLLQSIPLPTDYYKVFGNKLIVKDLHTAGKYYSDDILMLPHKQMLEQFSNQISKTTIQKIIIFSFVLALIVIGLIIYFVVFLKNIKDRIQKVEEIVGFIPFKKLSTIIGFKKYIRNKYKEGY